MLEKKGSLAQFASTRHLIDQVWVLTQLPNYIDIRLDRTHKNAIARMYIEKRERMLVSFPCSLCIHVGEEV